MHCSIKVIVILRAKQLKELQCNEDYHALHIRFVELFGENISFLHLFPGGHDRKISDLNDCLSVKCDNYIGF